MGGELPGFVHEVELGVHDVHGGGFDLKAGVGQVSLGLNDFQVKTHSGTQLGDGNTVGFGCGFSFLTGNGELGAVELGVVVGFTEGFLDVVRLTGVINAGFLDFGLVYLHITHNAPAKVAKEIDGDTGIVLIGLLELIGTLTNAAAVCVEVNGGKKV